MRFQTIGHRVVFCDYLRIINAAMWKRSHIPYVFVILIYNVYLFGKYYWYLGRNRYTHRICFTRFILNVKMLVKLVLN